MKTFSEPAIVMDGLSASGGDVHEHTQRVIQRGQDSIEVREVFACLRRPSPEFKFKDGEVALSAIASGGCWDVNDNIGPDLDPVFAEALLVLLFNYGVTRQVRLWKPRAQFGQKLALVTALCLEEARALHAHETLDDDRYHSGNPLDPLRTNEGYLTLTISRMALLG